MAALQHAVTSRMEAGAACGWLMRNWRSILIYKDHGCELQSQCLGVHHGTICGDCAGANHKLYLFADSNDAAGYLMPCKVSIDITVANVNCI